MIVIIHNITIITFFLGAFLDDALLILQDARKDDFDFITTNLPHSSALNRRDVTLIQSKWWSTSIVGSVTTPSHTSYYKDDGDGDIDINGDNDSETAMETSENEFDFGQNLVSALSDRDPSKRKLAIEHFQYMLDWTAHMNIPAAILPPIPTNNDDYIHYARFLATQALKSGANNVQLWIRVDFNRESVERFQRVHRLCDGAANLGCILVFQSNMAKIQLKTKIEGNSTSASAQSQSQSEDNAMCMAEAMTLMHQLVGSNLRAVAFQTDMFLTNKRGFPTLSKAMQIVFIELLKRIGRTCRVMVEGMPIHEQNQDETSMGHSGMLLYLQYLRHLRSKDEVKGVLDTEEAKMETSYLDHLQSALQPLGDNLEFSTYEVVSTVHQNRSILNWAMCMIHDRCRCLVVVHLIAFSCLCTHDRNMAMVFLLDYPSQFIYDLCALYFYSLKRIR